nr:hypothetical protein pFRL5_18c [Streptomyces sp. F8]
MDGPRPVAGLTNLHPLATHGGPGRPAHRPIAMDAIANWVRDTPGRHRLHTPFCTAPGSGGCRRGGSASRAPRLPLLGGRPHRTEAARAGAVRRPHRILALWRLLRFPLTRAQVKGKQQAPRPVVKGCKHGRSRGWPRGQMMR